MTPANAIAAILAALPLVACSAQAPVSASANQEGEQQVSAANPSNTSADQPGQPKAPVPPNRPLPKVEPSPYQPPAEVDPVRPEVGNETPGD